MPTFILNPLPSGAPLLHPETALTLISDGPRPCRRCLRNAERGEPLLLLPYDPFTTASPYRGEGPIFVHATGCDLAEPRPGELCEQTQGRLLSVRAFDRRAMLLGAEVIPGEQLAARANALLAGEVAFLHVHFAAPGCFAFRIDACAPAPRAARDDLAPVAQLHAA